MRGFFDFVCALITSISVRIQKWMQCDLLCIIKQGLNVTSSSKKKKKKYVSVFNDALCESWANSRYTQLRKKYDAQFVQIAYFGMQSKNQLNVTGFFCWFYCHTNVRNATKFFLKFKIIVFISILKAFENKTKQLHRQYEDRSLEQWVSASFFAWVLRAFS